jgi:hypothetical protein
MIALASSRILELVARLCTIRRQSHLSFFETSALELGELRVSTRLIVRLLAPSDAFVVGHCIAIRYSCIF